MNSDKLNARVGRGARMKEWAEGTEGLYAVFDAVERDYLKTIVSSEAGEGPFRETVYHRVRALRDVRRAIEAVISDGLSAASLIAAMNADKPKKKKGRQFA